MRTLLSIITVGESENLENLEEERQRCYILHLKNILHSKLIMAENKETIDKYKIFILSSVSGYHPV